MISFFKKPSPLTTRTELRTVDDRSFVIGLIELFRDRMKEHETKVLLPLAREAAQALGLKKEDVPIEGYYYETPELSEYFRLIRSLQSTSLRKPPDGSTHKALTELRRVLSSRAFSRSVLGDTKGNSIPQFTSPLHEALESIPEYSIDAITERAVSCVREEDSSIVAVACATGDAVALCAARESVPLILSVSSDIHHPVIEYEWTVRDEVRRVAERFLRALSEATSIDLPPATRESAKSYWHASQKADLDGRCIAIANRELRGFYHWYINGRRDAARVVDFWSPELWTTQRMKALSQPQRPRPEPPEK